jgi:uncharacterized protein (DUF305 family)
VTQSTKEIAMRRSVIIAAVLAAAIGGGAGYVLAQGTQMPGMQMPGMQMPGMQQPSAEALRSPSTAGFKAAMDKMMRDMQPLTGNPDRDFAAGMIPHHQGAIDMARIVLQYGKDAEVRKIAEDVISAQEKEIVQLRAILARLPAR